MTMPSAIACDNLGKSFYAASSFGSILRGRLRGRRIDALRNICLDVQAGEAFGVVGRNGAGKSTLLKTIAGLLLPDAGAVKIFGQSIGQGRSSIRARVSYIASDDRGYSLRLSGQHNLEFYAALYGLRGTKAREAVEAALMSVGLESDAQRGVREYSSGMRQRLAVARALIADPDILLLDEPTRGIDPEGARQLRGLVRQRFIERRCTVLVATNILEDVTELCGRVARLDGGTILGCVDACDVLNLWCTTLGATIA